MTDLINIDNLSCHHGDLEVLSGISFALFKGDYLGVVGPNGSGKSTLIKVILGLLPCSSGQSLLFGEKLHAFRHWEKIGYLPQNIGPLNPSFPATVFEIVQLGLLAGKGLPRRLCGHDRKQVMDVLDLLGIAGLKDRMTGELSGGQQQRVMLARAIVNNPELLVMDEPTAALDPEIRDRFYEMIKRLNTENGTTVLLVTHDIGTIGNYASKMLYLDKKVLFYGDFDEFCHSEEMSAFFGEHSQHLICHRH